MEELPPDAVLALQRGRMIEAIKIVRDRTGMDLKSCKEAVDRFVDRQEAGEGDPMVAGGHGGPTAARQDRGFASMPSTALTALAQGNKIEAIRAAVRGGWVNTLITDLDTARQLLAN